MPPAVAAPLSASALGAGASAAGAVDDNMQSFPAIAPDEAANVITLELGEPVSVEDIAKPTAAFVMRVFCTFLLSLSGISEEDMLQRRDEMISTMEYPQLYEESTYLQLVYREVRAMMLHAYIQDFVFTDMTRPTSKRLKRQLSALINFYRFRQDRLNEFEEAAAEGTALIAHRAELVENVERLRTQLEEAEQRHKVEQPQAAELRTENAELNEKLLGLKEEQVALLKQHDACKVDKADLAKRYEDLQLQLQLLGVDVRKLSSRVVQSPEQIEANVETQRKQLDEDKKSLADLEQALKSLQTRERVFADLKKDMEDCYQALTSVAADLDKYQREEEALEAIKSDIAESNRARSENEQKLAQIERALKSTQMRLDRLDTVISNRRSEAEKRMALVSEQMSKLRVEKEAMKRVEESKKEQADAVEKEYTDLMRAFDTYLHNARQERDVLENRAKQYMDAIATRFRFTS